MIYKEFDFQTVINLFHSLINLKFNFGTPTLSNSGSPRPQCGSCYLVGLKDDLIEGIYSTLASYARISKFAGGIGLHLHNLRGKTQSFNPQNAKAKDSYPFYESSINPFVSFVKVVSVRGPLPST